MSYTPENSQFEPLKSPKLKRKTIFQSFRFDVQRVYFQYFQLCIPSIADVCFFQDVSFSRQVMNSTWAFAKLTCADSELMVGGAQGCLGVKAAKLAGS